MPESHENSIGSLLGSGGISQLLQNPEIAAKLPRIMEALAPVMAEMKAGRGSRACRRHSAACVGGKGVVRVAAHGAAPRAVALSVRGAAERTRHGDEGFHAA